MASHLLQIPRGGFGGKQVLGERPEMFFRRLVGCFFSALSKLQQEKRIGLMGFP